MWPILKIDARTQIEAAPDEQTEMRCRSANQSLITDVFALRPYFCTIQLQPIRTCHAVRCQITASAALDGGHQILRTQMRVGWVERLSRLSALIAKPIVLRPR